MLQILEEFTIAVGVVRVQAQAGYLQEDGKLAKATNVKFHPNGEAAEGIFPACEPPKNLQLTVTTPEVLDLYVQVGNHLLARQKMVPGRSNVINRTTQGEPLIIGGRNTLDVWLCLNFGHAAPSEERPLYPAPLPPNFPPLPALPSAPARATPAEAPPLYPALPLPPSNFPPLPSPPSAPACAAPAPPRPSEVAAAEAFEISARRASNAAVADTIRGAIAESAEHQVRGGTFRPMNYDLGASWWLPIHLTLAPEAADAGAARPKWSLF